MAVKSAALGLNARSTDFEVDLPDPERDSDVRRERIHEVLLKRDRFLSPKRVGDVDGERSAVGTARSSLSNAG
jgi:hypothetical protein